MCSSRNKNYQDTRHEQLIFSRVVMTVFWILSGWIEKYKPALSKPDSPSDNLYSARLVIILLAVNISKLQSLVSEDNFFCWVYNDFCSDFLLHDVMHCVWMYKLTVESLDKKSFRIDWFLLKHIEVLYYDDWWLYESLLRIDEASLLKISPKFKEKGFQIHNKLFAIFEKVSV